MLDGNRLEEGWVTWLRRDWPALFEELAVVLPRIREFVQGDASSANDTNYSGLLCFAVRMVAHGVVNPEQHAI